MLKTSNPIERCLEEIRRRIITVRTFNDTQSVGRTVCGITAYVPNQQPDIPSREFRHSA